MTALITLLLPFYNEQGWIGATIDSLAGQTDRRFKLLLLDNVSTDGGRAEAEQHLSALPDIEARIIDAPVPGKVNALATGLALVDTPYVAVCDADTRYPPEYLERCLALFCVRPDAAAIMAIDIYDPAGSDAAQQRIGRVLRKSRLFRSRCHAGGYAQAYRTDALRAAGGFDIGLWPFVLEDHEIVHRVLREGPVLYDPGHYCFPSQRRTDRSAVSWTWYERLLYRYTPQRLMDWFFYDFLWRRLERRSAFSVALRTKDWM